MRHFNLLSRYTFIQDIRRKKPLAIGCGYCLPAEYVRGLGKR